MNKKIILTNILFLLFSNLVFGKVIKVGFEPFPPLINKDGTGLTVNLLKAIEAKSNLRFEVIIMPYSRAKLGLKEGRIDMIGHTPYQNETEEFYTYAQELDFNIEAIVDIYSKDKGLVNLDSFKTHKKIGTPRGNEDFFSVNYKIPKNNFYPGELDGLIRMLKKDRIKMILFERGSMMSSIKRIDIEDVYYQKIGELSASLAIKKSPAGLKIKEELDKIIKILDIKKIYEKYYEYKKLPDNGIVR